MAELIAIYRQAPQGGHPGPGTVMLAFHMLCHRDQAEAELSPRAAEPLPAVAGGCRVRLDGGSGVRRLPRLRQIIAGLAAETFETQVEKCAAWVGTPERILDSVATYRRQIGAFESASLQVNFNDLPLAGGGSVDAAVRGTCPAAAVGSKPAS